MSANPASVIVLAVLLVLAAGLFACVDAALGTVSRARVEALQRQGRWGTGQLLNVLNDRPRHVNLLLLLRLACEMSAAVLVTTVFLDYVAQDGLAVLYSCLSMLIVSYVLVGVGPRTLGRQHPYGVSLLAAGTVRQLGRVLGPLSKLLILIGNAITPGKGFREGPFSSEVELRELVDMAQERGVVDEGEREMIHSVFELGDTITREIMVPRTEIVWIEQSKSLRQALALSLRTGYTRVPVIGESVDDVLGVVNLKDLMRATLAEGEDPKCVSELMRPMSFIPDSKPIADLLREMQVSRRHMAIVVDEYGGTAGLLTIEDILEEIVGEITDESDTDDRPPVEHLEDGAVRVSARLPVDDLDALFGTELDDHEVETVGGLLAQRLGRVPLPGTEAEIAGLRMRAEGGKDERGRIRVTTVLVRPVQKETEEDD
ncbi:hemolysin family protein [Lentzea flaviverrucosa]|uniref:Hemolysin, contains CBS domains n=1 Tax=Lentzea flaviverrucosa TaxID=200379 RepID=A0A1H9XIQ3_9PSEU|nr:hemolysin family protein [Lentzea flaviverrucosa]RDI20212.1 CBS domain containing-hemolysin-like protein [Lentzea flaviverrucosa]SES45939.1 Hemolysin, contains CBS domains [Lentzea flaviverrucosa]